MPCQTAAGNRAYQQVPLRHLELRDSLPDKPAQAGKKNRVEEALMCLLYKRSRQGSVLHNAMVNRSYDISPSQITPVARWYGPPIATILEVASGLLPIAGLPHAKTNSNWGGSVGKCLESALNSVGRLEVLGTTCPFTPMPRSIAVSKVWRTGDLLGLTSTLLTG